MAVLGVATTYLFDVASDLLVIAALLWWKRKAAADDVLREHFGGALRAGLRFARASRPLRQVLLLAFLFFALASAIWALLPIVARRELGGGPGLYGILLGCVGAGAIVGALVLPRLKLRLAAGGRGDRRRVADREASPAHPVRQDCLHGPVQSGQNRDPGDAQQGGRRDGDADMAGMRPIPRSWSSGSSSNPGPSICASITAFRRPMRTSRRTC